MTAYKHLKIKKTDGVARMTFDRPKHNVLDIEMMNELNAELDLLGVDAELKCVVILGEGPSWCAGVEVADHKPEMVYEMIATFNGIFERIDKIDVPVIAAVHGACLGGGMEVAIACDVIVAAKAQSSASRRSSSAFSRPTPPSGCRSSSDRPRPSRSARPAGATAPKKLGKWGL